ncbi:MAG: TPM domain-containing protein [Lachnospiraceae bacterium]|jgi:uncharacterized membrane protein YgcG|nr:TPM domain-containing protein [Lachnospiraceae bacterium]
MRKGIHFLVLLAAALLLFSLPVRASDFEDDRLDFVTDEAGLLTDEEWTALETRAEELSTEYACGIYVITVDDFRKALVKNRVDGFHTTTSMVNSRRDNV